MRRFSCLHLGLLLVCLLLTACAASSSADRYERQAEQFLSEGRLPEAVLAYRQALVSKPEDPRLLQGLGLALSRQGRARSAAQVLEQAASLDPNDSSIKEALSALVTYPQEGHSLTLGWLASIVQGEPVGAAAAAGRVFVAYADGHLAALDQRTGHILWQIEIPAGLTSPPAADGAQVWIGAADGSILIFDSASGRTLGRHLTQGAVYAAPALMPTLAYCPSNDGTLYVLRRDNFEQVWKAVIGAPLHASPLVSEQAVYVGANDGRLYGFNALTGERIWAYGVLTQGAVESIPVQAGGRVFVGSGDGRVYALEAATGGEYWRFSSPDAVYASPLILGEQVIVASSGQMLASLRYADGSLLWSVSVPHPIAETPVFFKKRLYLAMRADPRLLVVDPQDGNLLGELNTGDWIAVGPLATEAGLILVGKDGAVLLYH